MRMNGQMDGSSYPTIYNCRRNWPTASASLGNVWRPYLELLRDGAVFSSEGHDAATVVLVVAPLYQGSHAVGTGVDQGRIIFGAHYRTWAQCGECNVARSSRFIGEKELTSLVRIIVRVKVGAFTMHLCV